MPGVGAALAAKLENIAAKAAPTIMSFKFENRINHKMQNSAH